MIEVTIKGHPVPAVRQVKSDRWKPRDRVLRYRAWKDIVVTAFIKRGVRRIKTPAKMSFEFHVAGQPNTDLDNYIKGVKDALVRAGILEGDTWKHVPRYGESFVESFCQLCPDAKGKSDCGKVKQCKREWTIVRIEEG